MVSISCSAAAAELLRQCLDGDAWDPQLAVALAAEECSGALFQTLVEGLADRFEPRLCNAYSRIFALVLETVSPSFRAADLVARYERIRAPRICRIEPRMVVVLSRVTLGADIAVTSVILEAAKQRFPKAKIYLCGSHGAAELFARDPRVSHLEAAYPRGGTVPDRIRCWQDLTASLPTEDIIVIDPDSRLTQLGLLPVCAEERYFFFESRAFGVDSHQSLATLAAEWAVQTFEVATPLPRIAPPVERLEAKRPCVTVSLGVGGNAAKGMPEEFEANLIRLLCDRFAHVVVDRGSGSAEEARVEHAILGTTAKTFRGSFARFASLIGQSECYVGYDSAGQHAAAALGTPLATLFKGFVSERMFARWQPTGPAAKQIIKIESATQPDEIMASLASSFSRII